MEAKPSSTVPENATYVPLLNKSSTAGSGRQRRPLKGPLVIFLSIIFLMSLVALILNQSQEELPKNLRRPPLPPESTTSSNISMAFPRGRAQGVSAKANPKLSGKLSYNWMNEMLSWQRTAYHFQPQKNWMNDPDVVHRGPCGSTSTLAKSGLCWNVLKNVAGLMTY